MPTPTWRVGAFADRFSEARELGYCAQTESRALEALYATAGQRTVLSMPCCDGPCCCPKPPDEDAFVGAYPDVAKSMVEARAFGAAVRDILADPDLEDVAGAIDIATALRDAGQLAALYAPAVPTKKLPDGSDAPARCPICGAVACEECGRCCSCLMT
jgi:hypothetical protein